jgi:hypothetical protein
MLPLPAIAYWNGDHFVVVERLSSQGVELVDPAVGRRWLSLDHFQQGFVGIALLAAPTADDPRLCIDCLLLAVAATGAALISRVLRPGGGRSKPTISPSVQQSSAQ